LTTLQKVALAFTILGAINWGLIGLFDFNLVSAIFGDNTILESITYALIGLCGLFNTAYLFTSDDRK